MSEENVLYIQHNLLHAFVIATLKKITVPVEDAKVCADIIISASLQGIDSHGIERFKTFYYDRVLDKTQEPVTKIEIVREGPTTAVIDGHNGMGHVIAKKSMDLAISKAKKYGMGMVAVRNSTHYGIAGYYAKMATKANMIGITGTNARPSVAPTYGIEAMIGTNPLTFGMPSDDSFPFIMDAATSLAQRGKIEYYAKNDKPLPNGWVINTQGTAVTNAQEALEGLSAGTCVLTPLGGVGDTNGGYKGYGYATVVEILSASLQQGTFLKALSGIVDGKKGPIHNGHFFIAIDINSFIDPGEFKKTTGEILRTLRSSKKMPGHNRIYTPGEKEFETETERSKKGIPVNPALQNELKTIQQEQHLVDFQLPF